MRRVIILGTGGNCIDILDLLDELSAAGDSDLQCAGFLDDNEATWGREIHGVPVLGPLSSAAEHRDCFYVNGIGSVRTFWRKGEIIAGAGIPEDRFVSLVHPAASVSRMARVGTGTVVMANATVTAAAELGRHVMVLPGAVVSHDDSIGDYTCVAGGAAISGCVTIGHSSYIGSNSSIREHVTVGSFCLVGMGAVVLGPVPDNHTVVGAPARFLRFTRSTG